MRVYSFLYVFLILSFQYCPLKAQKSKWKIEEGWALRTISGKNRTERFFALGVWSIPSYRHILSQEKDDYKNQSVFLQNTLLFNSVYLQAQYLKKYMNDKIIVIGSSEFPWFLNRYLERNYSIKELNNKGKEILEEDINKESLNKEINNAVNLVYNSFLENNDWDYIWAPVDEVESWSPSVIEKIYNSIKQKNQGALVYVDLTGNGRNRSYSNRNKSKLEYKGDLLSFISQWRDNIKSIASEYKNGGDVFGINSYGDFYEFPILAGVSVEAIKSGLEKDAAVWLFFDPVGYAKPSYVSLTEYQRNVKCQIYTSIIYGATGVLFWNDVTKDAKCFNSFLPILSELKKNEEFFSYTTKEKKNDGDLHYVIKQNKQGDKYIIASNTSKNTEILMTYPIYKLLKPLEVYIKRIK